MPVHGTTNTYRHYGCRCDECRAAQAKSVKEYREGQFARKKSRLANRRAVLRHKLAAHWVKANHPEIWKQICEQVTKTYSESIYLRRDDESDFIQSGRRSGIAEDVS